MSWFSTGYESAQTAFDESPRGGSGKSERVYLRADTTKRFLFLDDDPAAMWEHQYKYDGKWTNWEPCHEKNKMLAKASGGSCPICKAYDDRWPYFVGIHTVIDLTPWFTKKDNIEMCFNRRMFAAKMGSKDKPGVMKKLEKLKAKHGRLRGLIFDVERPGSKTEVCGSEFDLVEKIDSDKIETYCMEQLTAYVARRNEKADEKKQVTIEKLLEWSPWEPYNWDDVLKATDIRELRAKFSNAPSQDSDSKKNQYSDADDSGKVDDDIPY